MRDLALEVLFGLPDTLATVGRRIAVWLATPLGVRRRRDLERWLRGRQQVSRLRRADVVVVSYGKAGRTWLRVLLSGFYHRVYGIPARSLLGFDNFHRRDARIPRVFFTHDNYIGDYTGHRDSKRDFYDKKVVLLVRSPQDTGVSQYFQWKHRMRPGKKRLNEYPEHGADVTIADFLMRPASGLPKIVDFMNRWAAEAPRIRELLLVRYEDLRADPEGQLRRIVRFLGGPTDDTAIRAAVAFASVENMRAMEERRAFWFSGLRMTQRDRANPDSYKVRRARVGGYRDYFDDEEVARIDALVRSRLSPFFGYGLVREGTHLDSRRTS
ncbi:MAG TPA: sulfotransferase domain-containing protein [Myxococcota bacterium]|nr:sulfotransferase domain-containing protein [Myxococcota bacterium]